MPKLPALDHAEEVPLHILERAARLYRGLDGILDFGQGVLDAVPDSRVLDAVAQAAMGGVGVKYARALDLYDLSVLVGEDIARSHHCNVMPSKIAITNGASEAFCGALSVILGLGDEVIFAQPFYYAHYAWAAVQGIATRTWDWGHRGLDIDYLRSIVTSRTKAVVVVSPANPTGAQVSSADFSAMLDLCRTAGVWLVVDETYRSFVSGEGPVHRLFEDDGWADNLICIYSLSKDFGLAGYRIGSLVATEEIQRRFSVWREGMSISPGSLGVVAATASLVHGLDWRHRQVEVVRRRVDALRACVEGSMGFLTWSCGGAMYGWVCHRQLRPDHEVAAWFARELGVVCLPGRAFSVRETGHLRFSVGTLDESAVLSLGARLSAAMRDGGPISLF